MVPDAPIQNKRFLNRSTLGFLLILGATIFLLPYLLEAEWGRPLGPDYSGPEVLPRSLTPSSGNLSNDEHNTIEVFNNASKSVVFIENTAIHRDPWSFNLIEVPQGALMLQKWEAPLFSFPFNPKSHKILPTTMAPTDLDERLNSLRFWPPHRQKPYCSCLHLVGTPHSHIPYSSHTV